MNDIDYKNSRLQIARRLVNGFDKTLNHIEQMERVIELHGDWGDETTQKMMFLNVIDNIKSEIPSLIELGTSGTDGSIYSIVFEKRFNYNCKIVNTEPNKVVFDLIKPEWQDTELHLLNASIYHCYTGNGTTLTDRDLIEKKTMLQLFQENELNSLDVLHVDIQGDEVCVLKELEDYQLFDKICYFFINTHYQGHNLGSHNTYFECLDLLKKNIQDVNFIWTDPFKGGCGDGLIVCENLNYQP